MAWTVAAKALFASEPKKLGGVLRTRCVHLSSLAARAMFALLIGLTFFPSIGTTQVQDGPSFYDYPQTMLNGSVSAEINITVDRCAKICLERSGCRGFDYVADTRSCRLFSTVQAGQQNASSRAATKDLIPGYSPPANLPALPPAPEPLVRNFNVYPHFDLTGSDLTNFASDNQQQCEQSCRDNSQCMAYTFNLWNSKCFLKGDVGLLRLEPRAHSGILNGIDRPPTVAAPITMERYNNSIVVGDTTGNVVLVRNRDICESLCIGKTECMAYSFASARRTCSLFSNPTNRYPQSGVASGGKLQSR